MTTGGDLVGDLGGELRGDSWYMEIGRDLLVSMAMPRVSGVRGGAYNPFGDVLRRPTLGRGRSSDMRPSGRARISSGPSKIFPRLGRALFERGGSVVEEDWRWSIFSKWLRNDDTGFYKTGISTSSAAQGEGCAHYGGAICALRPARRLVHDLSARTVAQLSVLNGLQRTHAPSLGDYKDRKWPERRKRMVESGSGSMPNARETGTE